MSKRKPDVGRVFRPGADVGRSFSSGGGPGADVGRSFSFGGGAGGDVGRTFRSGDLPKDQAHRDRLVRDFDRNLLVEAGAGSGKTHSLARRMAAGIAEGHYQIEHMAAVTFTRKAAAELRGRFQLALEEQLQSLRSSAPLPPLRLEEAKRLEHALSNLERFYAGTIHAFCAHLLRERPVESGIAPGFKELDEAQDNHRREESWRDYISQAKAVDKPELIELLAAGVKARELDQAFRIVSLYEEVDFPPGDAARPDVEATFKAMQVYWTALQKLMPGRIQDGSKCKVLEKAEEFGRKLRVLDSRQTSLLVDCLDLWKGTSLKVTFKWWDAKADAQRAQALFEEFRDRVVLPFLTAWRQYLYRLCVTVLVDARAYAARERRRHNTLNYGDLLQAAARVLREKPLVRRALQKKYRWLFVDEFQDTDPVQAEIIVLLAAEPDVGRVFRPGERETAAGRVFRPGDAVVDWTKAQLRPGALFVVGDPKQSIYRFRRADIDIYTRVKQQILDSGGEIVPLTANFRSVESLCEWANDVFVTKFPTEANQHAPAFESLDAFREDVGRVFRPADGIRTLTVPATVDEANVSEAEAKSIARSIRAEVDSGRRKFGDFLILTRKKKPLAVYSRALERYQIPLEVSGAGAFGSCEEVKHLAVLLRALADPQDSVALVGALRGPFFGISDPELFHFVQAGNRLWLWAGADVGRVFRPGLQETDGRDVGRVFPGPSEIEGRLGEESTQRVADALAHLRQMHRWTRLLPPAGAIDRILEATGYLALAATTPSAAAAGDLLHAIDRIRQVSEDGGTLMGAVQALEDDEEASTEIDSLPLEPGKTDVVRLMNLHKAKGLEAPVVFLADPCGSFQPKVDVRIVRNGSTAEGYFQLEAKGKNRWNSKVIAAPADWEDHTAAEQQYLTAEGDRLLYVAATRARDLLVVGRWAQGKGRRVPAWDAFDIWLKTVPELELPKRVKLPVQKGRDLSAGALERAQTYQTAACTHAAAPSWSVTSVTAEARHISSVVRQADGAVDDPSRTVTQDTPTHRADAGMAWGTLIHGLLEHAMRHKGATGDDLHRLGMWLTMERPELRGVLARAVALVQEVSAAPFWQEAANASEHHVEAPFGTAEDRTSLFGVVDLVFRRDFDWKIIDYKTDAHGDSSALPKYVSQLRAYEAAWHSVTGQQVSGSIRSIT